MEHVYKYIHRHNSVFRLNFFLAGLAGLSLLAWFFNTVPPKEGSVIAAAIILSCLISFCFLAAFIKNVRRCLIWSSGVGIFLVLRAANLDDPLYLILLTALVISLELALKNR